LFGEPRGYRPHRLVVIVLEYFSFHEPSPPSCPAVYSPPPCQLHYPRGPG
jgi:hypothetical protein